MKFVFLSGGIAGFVIAAGTAYLAGRGSDRLFLDGAIGCLAGAMLFRWFWSVVLQGLRVTYVARQKEAVAAAAAAAAAAKNAAASPLISKSKL